MGKTHAKISLAGLLVLALLAATAVVATAAPAREAAGR